jgi:sigma-B regulation protein RsbU (phosphoserine phosphatase)
MMKKKNKLTAEIKYHLLKDISHKIRGTLDLNKILNLLLDILKDIINYDAAGIFIIRRDVNHPEYNFMKQKIAAIAQRGFGDLPLESDAMLMEGKGIIGKTIITGKSILLQDVRKDKTYIAGRKQTLSEITSPIFRDGKTIGALNVESDKLDGFTPDDIKVLDFFAEATSISIERALLHYQILEKEKMEEQLKLAKDIQLGLLPYSEPQIKGYQFSSIWIPTYEIGGDYFDYITLEDNKLAIVVADVSGDGIPAALIMAAFRALLRYNAKRFTDPGDLMKLMNELVPEFMRSRDFISIFYGILDNKSHKFKYCNCGHNPSLLWQENKIRLLEKTGPSLNLLKVADFNTNEIILNNNDLILLYTDGVVEVFDKSGEQFGLNGLKEVFEKHSTKTPVELIENIIFSTREFNSSEIYNDDFTLLVLKRNDTIN